MITTRPVPSEGGWLPVPNEVARDTRISRRAFGLLVEYLSYPSGWDITADSAAAKGREGREATRTAMAELMKVGYAMRVRFSRGGGTWQTELFAAFSEPQCAELVETWFTTNPGVRIDEKGSSYRRTGFRASENQASAVRASDSRASNRRLTTKTETKTVQEQHGAAHAASCVDAVASTDCGAVAPRSEPANPRERAKPQRRQSLATYLKTLGTEAIDEIYWDFDTTKSELLEWAKAKAREDLSVPAGEWPDGEMDDKLTLKAVEIAIRTLRKRSYCEFGEVAEGYLEDYDWPPEKNAPQAAQDAADAPLRYRHSPGFLYCTRGREDAALGKLHAAIDRMSASEVTEALKLFDAHRPARLAECRQAAEGVAAMHPGDYDRQVLHAAAEYYRDWHRDKTQTKWPKFVVPPELHPKEKADAEAA